MSVNSDMKKTDVFVLMETESPSGAKKKDWIKQEKQILVAIYQIDQFVSTEKFRNTDTTHQALTFSKNLVAEKTKLNQGDRHFEVLSVDNNHRLSSITLKEVAPW